MKFKRLLISTLFCIFTLCNSLFAFSHLDWDGETPYIEVNSNIPNFSDKEKQNTEHFIELDKLDNLGRTGVTFMNIDYDYLPKSEREGISVVYPSGWKYQGKTNNNKYSGIVSGNYIYNRCHMLPFQASGLNAEKKNLFTGTRYINVVGQLPFEDDATEYVKKTKNHVLYRCTTIFEGDNLICEGVQLEGWSVEDNGEGICFNVFCPNVQPNIVIDYKTGRNWKKGEEPVEFSNKSNINTSEEYNEEVYEEEIEETIKKSKKETIKEVDNSAVGGTSAVGLLLVIGVIWILFSGNSGSSNSSNNSTKKRNRNIDYKNFY